ncbi:hypothetical protein N185_08585 [Sinorhizobium sp. GW3]|nr:hypothetical protein N185_08585 [Sinorhizobium sp. GW3]
MRNGTNTRRITLRLDVVEGDLHADQRSRHLQTARMPHLCGSRPAGDDT